MIIISTVVPTMRNLALVAFYSRGLLAGLADLRRWRDKHNRPDAPRRLIVGKAR
jgi:hypothetical protein